MTDTNTEPSGSVYDAVDALAEEMHLIAKDKGWYNPAKSIIEQIALWHSECSEALEEARKKDQALDFTWYHLTLTAADPKDQPDNVVHVIAKVQAYQADVMANGDEATAECPTPEEMEVLVRAGIAKPEGFGIEAADVVIRIMDTLAFNGISLGQAIRLKALYNRTRPHRHGGKLA